MRAASPVVAVFFRCERCVGGMLRATSWLVAGCVCGRVSAVWLELSAALGAALAGSLGALLGFVDSLLDQVLGVFGDPAVRQQRLELGIADRGHSPVDVAEAGARPRSSMSYSRWK